MRDSVYMFHLSCVGRSVLIPSKVSCLQFVAEELIIKVMRAFMVWADDSNLHHNMYAHVWLFVTGCAQHTNPSIALIYKKTI